MRNFAITIMLAVCGTCCYSQDVASKTEQQDAPEIVARKAVEIDLGTRKKNLIAQSEDLESIARSLSGVDMDIALAIDRGARRGETYLDAVYWFVGMYNRMQCDEDKNLAKTVLQNRLEFYAYLLDLAVNQTNGHLGITRVPAVAQQGQRIRDELRSAKNKLNEIHSSLK